MIERITELSEPPVVGRMYLVPTVKHGWNFDLVGNAWPVFLPRHDDTQFFNFTDQHYHIDPRFVGVRDFKSTEEWSFEGDAFRVFQNAPLHRQRGWGKWAMELTDPVWRRRLCHRTAIPYRYAEKPPIQKLKAHFAGQTAPHNRHGWVCPHQHASLGSIVPEAGVITCPLHGLRIRASDGRCLSASE